METIKANELRIGSLVYGINRRSEVHLPIDIPLKVLQIGLFNSECLPEDQNPAQVEQWFKITNSDLSPIPLTPEWLERAGFENESEDDCHIFRKQFVGFNRLTIAKLTHQQKWELMEMHGYDNDGEIAGENFIGLIPIQFVHQLQNLYFVMTGKELISS